MSLQYIFRISKETFLFILVVFLTLLLPKFIFGQKSEGFYKHYTANDGLPTQSVYKVFQDSYGFLWVATEAGVSRFDGKSFKNFNTNDGLGDNEVLDIYEDQKGRIWFIPFSEKISYYHQGKFNNSNNNSLLKKIPPGVFYTTPLEDAKGNLFFRLKFSDYNILKINQNGNVELLVASDLIANNETVLALYKSSDGNNILCLTDNGKVFLLKDNESIELKKFDETYKFNEIKWHWASTNTTCPAFSIKNEFYYLKDTNIFRLEALDDYKTSNKKLNITIDYLGNAWLQHPELNTLFFRKTLNGYAKPKRLLSSHFTVISFDNESNIWFSTINEGLFKLPYSRLLDSSSFYLNEKLPKKNIVSMCIGKNGSIWIGYSNGLVLQFMNKQIIKYDVNSFGTTHNRVVKILEDSEGDIWIGTDESLVLLRKVSEAKYSSPILILGKNSGFTAIKDIEESDSYILATSFIRIFEINKRLLTIKELKNFSPHSSRLYNTFIDKYENSKLISTAEGLLKVTRNSIMNLANADQSLKTRIQDFSQNNEGVVFLASYSNGIIALKNNKVIGSLTKKGGLKGDICRKILCHSNKVYIATNAGVTIAEYNNGVFKILNTLNQINGLPSSDVNEIFIYENQLFVATSEGIGILQLPISTAFNNSNSPPKIILQEFIADGNEHSFDSVIKLAATTQRVSISFISPIMNKPEIASYRYRFVNLNQDWNEIKNSSLEFNKLPHGEYKIELQAKKYNSTWSNSAFVSFVILPPFYATTWFRISIVSFLILSFYFLVRYFLTRRFRKQLAELKYKEVIEKERNRIASDLHDDIGAELTNIVILSEVLQSTKYSKEKVIITTEKLKSSANEIINKMNEVIWTLNTSNNTLYHFGAYIRTYLTKFKSSQKIEVNILIDDHVYSEKPLKKETSRNLFLSLKEALNNIVKHADATKADISIKYMDSSIIIEIKDDGKGFELGTVGKGMGLINMQKRVDNINGVLIIKSIEGKGTRIKISVVI